MKKLIIVVAFLGLSINAISQNIYNENIDGSKQISEAKEKAKKENKHILVMVGGNWCKWCLIFDEFISINKAVNKILEDNYVLIHINYSNKNKNGEAMKELGFPQRFGFPVFIILDKEGRRIHTQNSAYLEQNESYSEKEVISFLNHWTRKAIRPNLP